MGYRIAALLVLATSFAFAEPAAVKEHLARAKAHFDLQEYGEAERELKEAYRLAPKPDVLYAVAQAQRMGGACDRAIVTYKTYLRGNPPPAQRKLAEDNIKTCEAALAAPIKSDPIKPDPIKPDPIKPDPIKPDPIKPDPIKPDPIVRPEAPPHPEMTVTVGTPWYKNGVGHGFLLGGVGAVVGGVLLALHGEKKIDRINNAEFYDEFLDRSADADSARSLRKIGMIAAGVGAASIGVSLVVYKVRSPRSERRPASSVKILFDPRGVRVAWER